MSVEKRLLWQDRI